MAAVEPGPELVLADGRRLAPDHVVLAAGTGLPAIAGLADAGLPVVRPVKGHILRLGPRDACGPPPRRCSPAPCAASCAGTPSTWCRAATARWWSGPPSRSAASTRPCRRGPSTSCSATPGRSSPASTSSSCSRPAPACARPRPTTRLASGGPAWTGVVAAVGHYRNGILLAPLTAAAVVDLVGRRPVTPLIEALAPA